MAAKCGQNVDLVVVALAGGASATEAARQVGVSARTVRRWLADEAIAARVRAARSEIVGQAVGVLTLASVRAAETLSALLSEESPMIRLSAAKAILEARGRLWDGIELEERMAALERLAAQVQGNGVGDGNEE